MNKQFFCEFVCLESRLWFWPALVLDPANRICSFRLLCRLHSPAIHIRLVSEALLQLQSKLIMSFQKEEDQAQGYQGKTQLPERQWGWWKGFKVIGTWWWRVGSISKFYVYIRLITHECHKNACEIGFVYVLLFYFFLKIISRCNS